MKQIVLIVILIIAFVYYSSKTEAYTIPDDSIRLRVIANSDSNYDQIIKDKVSIKVQSRLFQLLQNSKGLKEARTIINNNISLIKKDISKLLEEENYSYDYHINYGLNYFPEKSYKGVIYEEGDYESLLIVLGSGKGKNWWCVLFPPLCLIEAEESSEVEYKIYIKELIDKYL